MKLLTMSMKKYLVSKYSKYEEALNLYVLHIYLGLQRPSQVQPQGSGTNWPSTSAPWSLQTRGLTMHDRG